MILSILAALQVLRTMERVYEAAPPSIESGPKGKDLELAKELQSRVAPMMWNDQSKTPAAMMRWLVARKKNVDKAEKMVKTHVEWRKKWKITEKRNQPADPEMLKKFWFKMSGTARDGMPVLLMTFGIWDIRKYLRDGGDHDKFYFHQSLMWEKALIAVEEVEKKSKGKKNAVGTYYMICDMLDLQYAQIATVSALQSVIEMALNFEENYPEVVKYAMIINSDWVFDLLISLLRPFMTGSIEKLKVLGDSRKKWEKFVRRYIDPKEIPQRFGGYSNEERKKMGLAPIREEWKN